MATGVLWGEVEEAGADLLGLTGQEREGLATTSRTIAVEGPKFHQPVQVLVVVMVEGMVLMLEGMVAMVVAMVEVTVLPRAARR